MNEIVLTNSGWAAPLTLLLFCYGALVYKRPIRAAQTAVFLLPAYLIRIRIFDVFPTNLTELFLLVFVAVMIVRVLRRKETVIVSDAKALWGGVLFVTGGIISATITIAAAASGEHISAVLGSLKGFYLLPAIAVAILAGVQQLSEQREKILKAYILSALSVSVISLLLGLFAWVSAWCPGPVFCDAMTYDLRLRGFYLSPNHLAMYVMPALMLLGVYIVRQKDNISAQKGLIWPLSALFVLGLALSLSKSAGAVLGLLFGVGVFWFLYSEKRRRATQKTLPYVFVALLLLGVIISFIGAGFADNAWAEGWRSPLASRTMIWRVSVEMLTENWLFGVGPAMFQETYLELQGVFPPYLEWAVPTPHNIGLAVWLGAGITGFVGFLLLLFSAGRRVARDPKYIAASVALAAILVHGFVDTPFLKNDLSAVLLLLAVF